MSTFYRNVLIGSGGVVAASAIGLLLLPFVTRVYSPEQIGVWQIVLTASMVFVPLATIRFESALVLEEDKYTLSAMNGLLVCSFASIFIISALVVLLGNSVIIEHYKIDDSRVLYFMPVAIFFIATSYIGNGYLIKNEKFTELALIKIASALVFPLTALAVALWHVASSFYYVVAGCLLYITQCMGYFYVIRGSNNIVTNFSFHIRSFGSVLTKYSSYPRYMVPYALSSTLVVQLTAGFFALMFGPAVVGAFFVAQQVTYVPITVIATGLRNVLFAYGAKEYGKNPENVKQRVLQLSKGLAILVLPGACFAFFFVEDLMMLILGDEWGVAAEYSKWLIIPSTSLILTSWLDRMFEVVSKQKLSVILQIVHDVGVLIVFLLAYVMEYSALGTIKMLSIYKGSFNLVWLFVLFKNMGIQTKHYAQYIVNIIGIFVVFGIISYWARLSFDQGEIGYALILGLLFVLGYASIMYILFKKYHTLSELQ